MLSINAGYNLTGKLKCEHATSPQREQKTPPETKV